MYWDPFEDMSRMYHEMNRIFNREFSGINKALTQKKGKNLVKRDKFRVPLADIKETEKEVIATFEIPGADKNDIELNIKDNNVEVKVEKKDEKEVKDKDKYSYQSYSSSFYRSLPLPSNVSSDKAKASYENGVLKVTIPKKEQSKDQGTNIPIE